VTVLVTAALVVSAIWLYLRPVSPDPRLKELLPGTWTKDTEFVVGLGQKGDNAVHLVVVIGADGTYQCPRRDIFTRSLNGNTVPDTRPAKGAYRWVGKDEIELDGGGEVEVERMRVEILDNGNQLTLVLSDSQTGPHRYWIGSYTRGK
jgi:hypothetical protein